MERRINVVLGHMRRYLRDLPQFPKRAINRVPSEPVPKQLKRAKHSVRELQPRLPLGLRSEVVEDEECLSAL